jgi:propanol-preferring alcohol dehydrogenase
MDRVISALGLAYALPRAGAPLAAEEREVPTPAAGQMRIRISACAVCRTDLQIAEGDIPARKMPIVPGHQIVGRVESDSSKWKKGDRVGVAWLGGACGHCEQCRSGRENLCREARFTGWDDDGGFATHALVREDFAFAVPEAFDDEHAAPLLCGGIIGYRSLRRSGIQPGQRLGLFGFGSSAHLALQVAVHWKCRVFVWTRSEDEQERARALGAEWAGAYDSDARPPPVHAAVTFAPVGKVVIDALKKLERGGTLAINAIHLDGIPAFSYDDLWLERSICSVANFTREDAREFLALAAAAKIRPDIRVYPFRDVNQALADLKAGRVHGTAVLR